MNTITSQVYANAQSLCLMVLYLADTFVGYVMNSVDYFHNMI